jgi:AGCS family alanine or glycine:cation symporter
MAIFYLLATLYILATHSEQILPSLSLMISSAFGFQATAGGVLGYSVMQAAVAGFDRGLFATDAGTGIVPILQSAAKTKHPVIDGIVTLVAPFLVMIVCTATGLVLFVTGAYQTQDLQSTNMVTFAFEQGLGGKFGFYIVTVSLFLFAYTTCIAWAACGESAARFLSAKYVRAYRILYIALIPVGGLIHASVVWSLADICISLMLALNLVGIAGLSDKAIALVKEYFNKHPSHA